MVKFDSSSALCDLYFFLFCFKFTKIVHSVVRGFMIKLKFGATKPREETCILTNNGKTVEYHHRN